MLLDAYIEGKAAYKSDLRFDANPYPEGTESANDWELGWNDAWLDVGLVLVREIDSKSTWEDD